MITLQEFIENNPIMSDTRNVRENCLFSRKKNDNSFINNTNTSDNDLITTPIHDKLTKVCQFISIARERTN